MLNLMMDGRETCQEGVRFKLRTSILMVRGCKRRSDIRVDDITKFEVYCDDCKCMLFKNVFLGPCLLLM